MGADAPQQKAGACKQQLNDHCYDHKGLNQGANRVVWSFQSSDEQRRVCALWSKPMGLGRIFQPSLLFSRSCGVTTDHD